MRQKEAPYLLPEDVFVEKPRYAPLLETSSSPLPDPKDLTFVGVGVVKSLPFVCLRLSASPIWACHSGK